MFKRTFFFIILMATNYCTAESRPSNDIHHQYSLSQSPKLILQLTIDQFSGNQLERFKKHTQTGGFAYLIKHGLWYDNAHHPYATTQTAVGHTTLATGTVPAVHGIIANYWLEAKRHQEVYAMEDSSAFLLGKKKSQNPKEGRSPKNIQVSSFADSLALATNFKSKRYAVSTKDRGAIPLAGKMGKAFWFDPSNGYYTSSRYYFKKLPSWVSQWNAKEKVKNYLGQSWTLSEPCQNYIFCNKQRHFLSTFKSYGQNFPHTFKKQFNNHFSKSFTISPYADKVLLNFAKTLVINEKIGQGKVTDYLSISLSATDAIGHTFGPNSMESEDNFIRLNQNLGVFLKFIDEKIGLKHTLIVLSADHGVAPSPTFLKQYKYPSYEVSTKKMIKHPAVQAVLHKHKLNAQKLINTNELPDLYLNSAYLKHKKLSKPKIINVLIHALNQVPGIDLAVNTQAVLKNQFQNSRFKTQLINQIYPRRSGDIYIIAKPYVYIDDTPYRKVHHGTPWAYDTHIPIIFAHPSFTNLRVHRKVYSTRLAPTLAALSHSPPISGSDNLVFKEFDY